VHEPQYNSQRLAGKHMGTIFLTVHISQREESVVHMWGEMPDISHSQKYKHKFLVFKQKSKYPQPSGTGMNSWWGTS
jgi:hypothetical protein